MKVNYSTQPNGYNLANQWFEFADGRNDLKPIHHAIFHYLVHLSNRLKWKKEFGVPTIETMATLGISSHNTYKKAMDKLNELGVITYVEKSRNQHTATVIAMSFFDVPQSEQVTYHSRSTVGASDVPLSTYINSKTVETFKNNETTTDADGKENRIIEWFGELRKDEVFIEQVSRQHKVTNEEYQKLLNDFWRHKKALGELTHTKYTDLRKNFLFWIPKHIQATEKETKKGQSSPAFPNYWKPGIEADLRLTPEQTNDYYRHLLGLGWFKTTEQGQVYWNRPDNRGKAQNGGNVGAEIGALAQKMKV